MPSGILAQVVYFVSKIEKRIFMIRAFLFRIFHRCFWFYKFIIKERDSFMTYYYAVFSFTMLIIFYIDSFLYCLYNNFGIAILRFDKNKYFILSIILLVIALYFFFSKRKIYELELLKKMEKAIVLDCLVILYVISSFSIFFYTIFSSPLAQE